ncbi:putative uncharacterized protein [Waddlia chondrophila 2032/99]|uniref:Host attachment protein n=2 Tax=Waddlia chondrophila TaxID=71667 RepID=D6YWV7_WADCW|nr:host attachment protein [Waddlia chondrophila]ADI38618.1 hypothetical protein wcw_1266 [Waddlia chondrophila WSU 86-1044]CCB91678.1 putative uncharacterized protein [Waddlia chondrophila 2032/99]
MSKETWVLVANSSVARFFRLDKLQLIEMEAFVNPEGRMQNKDLASDKPGATFDGSGRYPMTKSHTLKEAEVEAFAKKVADRLDLARASGQVNRVFIAANPSFLGLLRGSMTHSCEAIVEKSIDKDITNMKPDEIFGYFPIGL